jgi:hypothetical protein
LFASKTCHFILLVVDMAPKRKDAANPAAAALAKQAKPGHDGARAGTGTKPKPINTPGADAADAPKRKQLDIGSLLGNRNKTPATETQPVITWEYMRHDGDDAETLVEQRQVARGAVRWDLDAEARAIVQLP